MHLTSNFLWEHWISLLCCENTFCRELNLRTFCSFGVSKPSLTIVLKNLKTIEKPLRSMFGWSKNIKWWWFNAAKTIEKPLMPMVNWKKNINHSIAQKKWPSNRSNTANSKLILNKGKYWLKIHFFLLYLSFKSSPLVCIPYGGRADSSEGEIQDIHQ